MRRLSAAGMGMVVALALGTWGAAAGRQSEGDSGATPGAAVVEVDLGSIRHTMAGGLGASWHAMSRQFTFNELSGLRNRNARGSAWGGNPPLDFETAWRQLSEHAAWLGLDWLRVELSQRMYEPRRREFDFTNEEMQALFRILDWAQAHGADVLLVQMWAFVDWNAFPGVPPLQSAPRSVEDFAFGLATLVERLVDRGYSCIRWLGLVNEPNARWWLGADGRRASIVPALEAVRAELDRRELAVALVAPGLSYLKEPPPEIFDFGAEVELGAYDAHSWGRPDVWGMTRWVELARQSRIPFFLSEIGDMRFGWKSDSPGPASWGASLSNAEKVILGLNLGVDAFSRWSFTNRGDLDGQFQLVRTWDRQHWEYLREVVPEPVPYHSWALLTRFSAKRSQVVETSVTGSDSLLAATLRSPRGELTLYLLNKASAEQTVEVRLADVRQERTLVEYRVTEAAVREPDFTLRARAEHRVSETAPRATLTVPALGLAALTTYRLGPSDPGVIAE